MTGNGEQGFKRITKASVETRRSIASLEKSLVRMKTQRDLATDPRRLRELNREIARTERAIEEARSSTNRMGVSLGTLKTVGIAAGAAVAAGMYKAGRAAISASSQMEKYQVTLRTMLGSTKAAGERMAEYMDIAKMTPFELSEVVEGGNQLQAMGRYSRENLEMLGDLAAASGKPLQQVMGAYAKLSSGQKGIAVDMFRDLLISTNDWVEATGKGVKKSGELQASVEEMMAALPRIMEKKGFMGLMAAQAETTEGKVSNLKDAIFGLSDAMGERMQPKVKSVVGWMSKMTARMEEAVRIPMEQKIAAEKVELNSLVGMLMKSNEGEERRDGLIAELNRKYPEFLKNLNLETEGAEGLRKKLVEVNKEYDIRMRKAALERRLTALEEEKSGVMDDIVKYQLAQEAGRVLPAMHGRLRAMGTSYETMKAYGGKHYNDAKGIKRQATPEMQALYAEIQAYEGMRTTWGQDAKQEAKAKRELEVLNAQTSALQKMYGEVPSSDAGTEGDGTTGGGSVAAADTTGGGSAVMGGSVTGGSGSGGGGGRSVVTKIGTLVGEININTTHLSEGAAEVKRLVAQALMEAIPSN